MNACNQILRVATLLALAYVSIPTASSGQVAGDQQAYEHDFPPLLTLKAEWLEFNRQATPKVVHSLLQKDALGKHVVERGKRNHLSVWALIDQWLTEHPEMVGPLRELQTTDAPRQLLGARRSGDPDRLVVAQRSFPWAESVHRSQIKSAEKALRDGQPQVALRHFRDVLRRSENAELRRRAQAGAWLAAAHAAESTADIDAMFRDADTTARYPWFGEPLSAKAIQAKLAVGMKTAKPFPAFDAIKVRALQLPDDPPWMGQKGRYNALSDALLYRHKVEPVVGAHGTTVAGPCLVAWYTGGTLNAPAWSKIATMDITTGGGGTISPKPPFAPLLAEGMIFVRCGTDLAPDDQPRTRDLGARHKAPLGIRFLDQLAAFDQQTGKKIWSSKDHPDWAQWFVVNAPVYRGGRLYMLALLGRTVRSGRGVVLIGGKAPIHLVIADARTGRPLHSRELVAYHTRFQRPNPAEGEIIPPRKGKRLDLSADAEHRGQFFPHNELNRYGNRLTVHEGAVYVLTAMGAVARCDARDGLIEWVTTYPQLRVNSTGVLVPSGWTHAWDAPYTIRRRQGIAPLVSGRVVVLSPRDTVAVFAVDRDTGKLLWQKKEIEDAVAAKSGKPATDKKPVEGPADQHVHDGSLEAVGLLGDSVLVTFDRKIAALEVTTGKVRWTIELDRPIERPIKVVDQRLYLVTATDLYQIDGATGKTVATRTLAPLRADTGYVFDDQGLIIVRPGRRGITFFSDGPLTKLPPK
jgi:outer membrane protein assembly factor BamB